MRAKEFIIEGGWEDTITQQTKLTPAVVKQALKITEKFIGAFNKYLIKMGEEPIEMGHALGSTAYHNIDKPDTEYGDIDLQVIAPDHEGMTESQFATKYNKLMNEFVASVKLPYVFDTGRPANGHPIFTLGKDTHVQVDFLWTQRRLSDWSRYRRTPMHGVKGLILGNMYSTLGEIMDMSLQQAVVMKIKDGEPVNYQKTRKYDELIQVSDNIGTFGADILKFIYDSVHGSTKGLKVDDLLRKHPGLNREDIQVSDLAKMVKGLAKSFALNDLYGKFNLKQYSNEDEFLKAYLDHYLAKAHQAGHGKKLDKAVTPAEKAKVQELRNKIAKGVEIVKKAFAQG